MTKHKAKPGMTQAQYEAGARRAAELLALDPHPLSQEAAELATIQQALERYEGPDTEPADEQAGAGGKPGLGVVQSDALAPPAPASGIKRPPWERKA